MASTTTIINVPSNVGGITKGLDYQTYVGLRPLLHVRRFNCLRATSIKSNDVPQFVVRAGETHNRPFKKLGLSDAECEAAVVAGNVPVAPPVPPKPTAPAGTSVVLTLVSNYSAEFCVLTL